MKEIQDDLKRIGFNSVREFQSKYGLVVDGSAGPATQAKLMEVAHGVRMDWLNKQTLVIRIPHPKLDVIFPTVETVSATYRKLLDKPLILCNGGIFSRRGTMTEIIDNKVVTSGVLSKYVMTDKGALGMYLAMANNAIPDEAIGAGPLLTLNGRVHLDLTGFDRALVNSLHPRLALGYDKEKMTLVVVHGRRPHLGHKGCSIPHLADLMLSLGCKDSIGLDGGGSIYVVNRYGRVLNMPTETRRVNHCIALRG